MSKFDFGKGLIKTMQGAAGVIKNTVEEAKIPDVKLPDVKIPDVKASEKLKKNSNRLRGTEMRFICVMLMMTAPESFA